MRNPEIAPDVDDIFMEFYADFRSRMANRKYLHQGKLDRWIAVIWGRYFFPGVQQEVYRYLDTVRFVNNLDPEGPGYKFEDYCVNTTNITSDAVDSRGSVNPVGRFIRELNNRESPLFVVTERSKDVLIGALQGETRAGPSTSSLSSSTPLRSMAPSSPSSSPASGSGWASS